MPKTRRVSKKEWATRVAAWEESGEDAVEFCKAPRRWDPAQLRWWRWKLRRVGVIAARSSEPPRSSQAPPAAPTFLRLVTTADDASEIAPPDATSARCELVLCGGRVLRFGDAVTPARVRALVDALEVRA